MTIRIGALAPGRRTVPGRRVAAGAAAAVVLLAGAGWWSAHARLDDTRSLLASTR